MKHKVNNLILNMDFMYKQIWHNLRHKCTAFQFLNLRKVTFYNNLYVRRYPSKF